MSDASVVVDAAALRAERASLAADLAELEANLADVGGHPVVSVSPYPEVSLLDSVGRVSLLEEIYTCYGVLPALVEPYNNFCSNFGAVTTPVMVADDFDRMLLPDSVDYVSKSITVTLSSTAVGSSGSAGVAEVAGLIYDGAASVMSFERDGYFLYSNAEHIVALYSHSDSRFVYLVQYDALGFYCLTFCVLPDGVTAYQSAMAAMQLGGKGVVECYMQLCGMGNFVCLFASTSVTSRVYSSSLSDLIYIPSDYYTLSDSSVYRSAITEWNGIRGSRSVITSYSASLISPENVRAAYAEVGPVMNANAASVRSLASSASPPIDALSGATLRQLLDGFDGFFSYYLQVRNLAVGLEAVYSRLDSFVARIAEIDAILDSLSVPPSVPIPTEPGGKYEPVEPVEPGPPGGKYEPVEPVEPNPPGGKYEPVDPVVPNPPGGKYEPVDPVGPSVFPDGGGSTGGVAFGNTRLSLSGHPEDIFIIRDGVVVYGDASRIPVLKPPVMF